MIIDIPSNLALKHFGSSWIAFLVLAFGIVAIGSAFMKSFGALLATRVLLGFSEGGTLVSRDVHTVIGLELIFIILVGLGLSSR